MSKVSSIVIAFVCAAFLSGCSREFKADSSGLGASFSKTGIITEKSTDFTFHYEKAGKIRDLCNFIYFEGDTLCFSVDFSHDVEDVTAYFTNPATGKKYRAERIEKLRSRVYGFSLVGSILEEFLHDSLDAPIPPDRTIVVPFSVTVEVTCSGRSAAKETKGKLSVRF
jgi:hypothetical protein